MAHEGYVDAVSPTEIRGWVFDNSHANDPLEIEILADEKVVATLRADQYRPDLVAAEKGNGMHAFAFHFRDNTSSNPLTARIAGKRWFLPRTDLRASVPIRFDRRLAHSLEYGFPSAEAGFTEAIPSPDDDQIVSRLIEAFERARQDDPFRKETKDDLWAELNDRFHGEIISLLQRRDVAGVGSYLREAHANGITWGITQGPQSTEALRSRPDARKMVLTEFLDYLASLAEFLQILDVECPEQSGQWGENIHADPELLIARISRHIGIQAVPPQVIGSYFGIKVSRGIMTGRDLTALYAALRLKAISHEFGLNSGICEIGGGLGGVAYYCFSLGLRPFTIIDLPLINLLQGYFLLRALPNARIQLYGEQPGSPPDIRLLPTYCFSGADTKYDLLFNQDSIPEMHADYARAYLGRARSNVTHGFLSINQEARPSQSGPLKQSVVHDLLEQVGGFRQIYRFRHWLRAGYVEEFYRLSGS